MDLDRKCIGKWLKNKKYPQYRTSLDGWGITLNLAVPIKEIPIDWEYHSNSAVGLKNGTRAFLDIL